MRNKIILVLLLFAGGYGYTQYQRRTHIPLEIAAPVTMQSAPVGQFKCDGRIYCSQMTSCVGAD